MTWPCKLLKVMIDFLCHDSVYNALSCIIWGVDLWIVCIVGRKHFSGSLITCSILSTSCLQPMAISLHFILHISSYHLWSMCFFLPLSSGFIFPSSPVNSLLGHLALKKTTRKTAFGNLRRKSPEIVDNLLPRDPNGSRGLGWRRAPNRWMTYQRMWLSRRSW